MSNTFIPSMIAYNNLAAVEKNVFIVLPIINHQ